MRKTKLLLLTLTLAASITACGSDNKNTETDNNKTSETQTTQQAAETTTEKSKVGAYKYKITEKDSAGNILSESFYMDSTQKLVEYIKYNAAGKVIEEAEYREDNGELIELIKYSADGSKEEYRECCEWNDYMGYWNKKNIYESGVLKEVLGLDRNGNITSKESYTDGLITEYISYSGGKESGKTTYEYTTDGGYVTYYVAGEKTTTTTYNSKKEKIKDVDVYPGNTAEGVITRTYEKNATGIFINYVSSLLGEIGREEQVKTEYCGEYEYDSYIYVGGVKKPSQIHNADGTITYYDYYKDGALLAKGIYTFGDPMYGEYANVTLYNKNGGVIKNYPNYPQKEGYDISGLLIDNNLWWDN